MQYTRGKCDPALYVNALLAMLSCLVERGICIVLTFLVLFLGGAGGRVRQRSARAQVQNI